MISRITFLVVLGCILGCGRGIPTHTANPPALTIQLVPPAEGVVSTTLRSDLTVIQPLLEQQFEPRFIERGHPLESKYRWDFLRVSGPTMSIVNGQVIVTASYAGDFETKFFPGCHLKPVFPIITVSCRPGLAEKEGKWIVGALAPDCEVTLGPRSDTDCSVLKKDVRALLLAALNGDAIKGKATAAILHASLSFSASEAVARLAGPFVLKLPDGHKAYLYPGLTEIASGPVAGQPAAAEMRIMARCYPSMIVRDSPRPSTRPIKQSSGPIPAGTPFKIQVAVGVPYSVFTEQLKKHFRENPNITVGKGTMQVVDVYAADANGRLLVAAKVKGDLRGTIFMWGTPTLRANRTILEVPDLQLSLESKRAIDHIKVGVAEVIFGDLSSRIQPLLRCDLASSIQRLESAISGSHTTANVTLVLNVHASLAPGDEPLYSRPEAMVANVLLQGSATADVTAPLKNAVAIER